MLAGKQWIITNIKEINIWGRFHKAVRRNRPEHTVQAGDIVEGEKMIPQAITEEKERRGNITRWTEEVESEGRSVKVQESKCRPDVDV